MNYMYLSEKFIPDNEHIQGKMITIRKGGTEAFERRKNIYQTWKH